MPTDRYRFEPAISEQDLSTGRELRKYVADDSIRYAGYTPDSQRVWAVTVIGRLIVWDSSTGAMVFRSESPNGYAGVPFWSPDGRHVVTDHGATYSLRSGIDGRVRIELATNESFVGIMTHTFSRDGRFLAIPGPKTRQVSILRSDDGSLVGTFESPPRRCEQMGLSPDGKALLLVGEDTLRLWDVEKGTYRDSPFELEYTAEPFTIEYKAEPFMFTDDGRHVFLRGGSRVIILDLVTGARAQSAVQRNSHEGNLKFSADGSRIYSPVREGTWVFDARTFALIQDRWWGKGGSQLLAVQPDGPRTFVHAVGPSSIEVWNRDLTERWAALTAPDNRGWFRNVSSYDGGTRVVAVDDSGNRVLAWLRSRAEQWWGIAQIPWLWAVVVAATLLAWRLWRDLKWWYADSKKQVRGAFADGAK
jgi:WD40 repeat protein